MYFGYSVILNPMNNKIKKYFALVPFLLLAWVSHQAQVADVEFGKNRVQYHDDFDQWLYYESQNFITYWYGKARNHGVSTVKLAEQDHDEILDIIEHRINDKIELIVYSDVSDLKQSNIGSDEVFVTAAGQTKIEGGKVFVHFDGNHDHLRKQIRKGVAQVFLTSMFFGSNLQEVVQNSIAGAIPPWFQSGLSAYVGSYWDNYDDAELRNIFLHERKTKFKKLSSIYPEIVGQSFWYYVGITYGRSEISNLLYLTRINRSVEDAFLYVFGIPFEDIADQWHTYFEERYQQEKAIFEAPKEEEHLLYKKRKKRVPVAELSFNPQGNMLAITDNNIGKTRILLRDLQTGYTQKIFKHGFKNNVQATDFDYPQTAWLPDGSGILILYEHRDKIIIELHNFSDGTVSQQTLPERYERVFSMAAISGGELILSALSEGMIDLYYYTTKTRQSNRLTHDIYDDLDVSMAKIDGMDGILFVSNRPDAINTSRSVDTILPFKNFNLFHLAFEESGPKLFQMTRQVEANYREPRASARGVMYLSDETGLVNRKEVIVSRDSVSKEEYLLTDSSSHILDLEQESQWPDSTVLARKQVKVMEYQGESYFLTNNLWNIVNYDVHPEGDIVAETYRVDDKYKIYLSSLHESVSVQESLSQEVEQKRSDTKSLARNTVSRVPEEEVIRSSADDGHQYRFQSEFGDMETSKTERLLEDVRTNEVVLSTTISKAPVAELDTQPINRLRIVPYQLQFKLHDVSTNMDNDPLFGGLDSYAGFKREFEPVPLGILTKATFKDLFEDYVFEGGVRIPTTFNGTEFFLVFDDRKKRIDRQYAVYRKSLARNITENNEIQRIRDIILLGQYSLRYPLDIFNSVRATGTLRQDRTTFLATDVPSLENPGTEAQRIGLKLEYIFDNAIDVDINIKSGTRVKVYTEMVKRFALSFKPWNFKLSEGFMTVVGTDARHYFNFARHMVWASRVAAATSFGSEQILYYLGGSDNWLIPRFDQNTGQPPGNFAYQTISPNLRGFNYNVRNGATHALFNTELRIPFLKYLSRRPIKVAFLRHMQLVGFADLGAAWVGRSPFDEENPINIEEFENPPTVRIRVNYNRDPLVLGYGVGFRTMLFGYFIRLDYAWGVETRVVQKPKLHFSMGVDF